MIRNGPLTIRPYINVHIIGIDPDRNIVTTSVHIPPHDTPTGAIILHETMATMGIRREPIIIYHAIPDITSSTDPFLAAIHARIVGHVGPGLPRFIAIENHIPELTWMFLSDEPIPSHPDTQHLRLADDGTSYIPSPLPPHLITDGIERKATE